MPTQPWNKRAIGVIIDGIGTAVGLAAPRGGFVYHEATLIDSIATLEKVLAMP